MQTTYHSPLLDLNGAVAADDADRGVAAHYGEPLREQRRIEVERRGVVDMSHRDVIRVSGPDRLGWLHSLTTQALDRLDPFVGTTALILSPHGHVEHALYAVDDGEAFWAHLEPGTAEALVEYLTSMQFLMRVEVCDVSDSYAVVWCPDRSGVQEGSLLRRAGSDSLDGEEVFVPREQLTSQVAEAGPPAGIWAYEALRIAAHLPRYGWETDHRTIPNEIGWLGSAVDLDKGCYRGQETVARVHNLGRPPRRLAFLHFDGSAEHLPAHQAVVQRGDREVGSVTSSARHYELGPIGFALLKRNVPVDADLVADGVAAAQEVVVPPDVGLHVRPLR